MKRFSIFLSIFLLCPFLAKAGNTETELRTEVMFLTDSLCAGRGFGTCGAQAATFYLLRQFRNAGLRTSVQSFSNGGKTGHNVVAVTPGWFKNYIVIGAYFDGFGKVDGGYYPGADSNASGVAALLSLARSLPALCKGDTGIMFVAFDGHNASLSGAREFVARYHIDCDFKMMVNLDILGSTSVPIHKDRPDYLIALGASPYRFRLDNANREYRLDLSYDYYGSSNFTDLFYKKISDQKWFLDAGVPSVMFTSGITMDTNRMTDTSERLDFEMMARRVSLISSWISSML